MFWQQSNTATKWKRTIVAWSWCWRTCSSISDFNNIGDPYSMNCSMMIWPINEDPKRKPGCSKLNGSYFANVQQDAYYSEFSHWFWCSFSRELHDYSLLPLVKKTLVDPSAVNLSMKEFARYCWHSLETLFLVFSVLIVIQIISLVEGVVWNRDFLDSTSSFNIGSKLLSATRYSSGIHRSLIRIQDSLESHVIACMKTFFTATQCFSIL